MNTIRNILLLFSIFFYMGTMAQISKKYLPESFDATFYKQFELNKTIPESIRPQALLALSHYPDLKEVRIVFRLKKRTTPLTSRPKLLSTFQHREKRIYVITISTKTREFLNPILFENLPFNAQVGVLGHELGHIFEYRSKSSIELLGLGFSLANRKFVDQFEFNTDKIAIAHGLGYQLLDWSAYVRTVLDIREWRGAAEVSENNQSRLDQRYMNPATIKTYINANPNYQSAK